MSTENVAILFTDIVDSTALSQLLSPEEADEARQRHFSILRRPVAASGGVEVKNLGDGLMVVFVSASAALACAVAMQQAVDLDNRDRRHQVGLRIGLSGGEVAHQEGDYFGDPVVEASRLCSASASGQILAAEVVRLMAGRRNNHGIRRVGGLSLKGLPDPVDAVEVLWDPLVLSGAERPIPLPGRLSIRPGVGVIGREAELSELGDAVKRVGSGGGSEVLLISGEAGQGKTTLVAEAARVAWDGGACVLFGHCEEDLATPYQLFSEALGHFVTHAPDDQLAAHVDAHGSELAGLVPALTHRVPDLPPSRATDSDSERYLLFSAACGLLSMASSDRPVILVLDDLQWADTGSLLLLRHLVAAHESRPLLILGTFRDSELSHVHPLLDTLAALRRNKRVTRIELAGLDDTGVVQLMEAIAGYVLDDAAVDLAHAVYRDTDGNPFFVYEVLRHLSESGAIYQDEAGRWVAQGSQEDVALPESVREVVGARVGRLGATSERILSVAAVIGRDFDLELLSRATSTSDDALLDILDEAAGAALVRELADAPGRYVFAHALIQHTLYQDMGPSRRARTHRTVAEALEALCGDRPGTRVGELAHHWFSATQTVDVSKAVRYSREAGDAALAALAPDDALRYYGRALDLYSHNGRLDPALEVDLMVGLGTAQRQTGDPAFRQSLLDAAQRAATLQDTGRLVAAVLANDRGFYSAVGAIDSEKVSMLERAVELVSGGTPERALVLATLCSELAYGSPLERRRALADEAVAIARALDDDAVIVRVFNHVHVALQVPSLLDESLERTAEALLRAQRVGDPVQIFWSAHWRATDAARAADIEEMDRCIDVHGSMAEQLDQPMFTWDHTFLLAVQAQIAGDAERAESLASEAFRIGSEGGQPDAATIFGAQLIVASGQRGTMSELAPLIEEMATHAPNISRWLFGSLIAKAHVEGDRADAARVVLEDFAAAGFEMPLDQIWLTGMVDFAEAAIECRDAALALSLFERLEPWSAQIPATGGSALAPVSHYLGGLTWVLGRYDDADAYFAQALEVAVRMRAKFFMAQTELRWGQMLSERRSPGDVERARALLSSARVAASAHGYGTVHRRAVRGFEQLD